MDYTAIGKIINTHGIKGELKILPLTEDISRFDSLEEVYIGEDKLKVKTIGVKYNKDIPIVKFNEFDNINQVLKYKEEYLYVSDDNLIELREDSYFIFDLIGCKVEDMEGSHIGFVEDVIENPGNDVYVIKDKDKEYLVPVIKEFIKEINIDNKLIRIKPIEGMIE